MECEGSDLNGYWWGLLRGRKEVWKMFNRKMGVMTYGKSWDIHHQ
jgi:hypothetical protein